MLIALKTANEDLTREQLKMVVEVEGWILIWKWVIAGAEYFYDEAGERQNVYLAMTSSHTEEHLIPSRYLTLRSALLPNLLGPS